MKQGGTREERKRMDCSKTLSVSTHLFGFDLPFTSTKTYLIQHNILNPVSIPRTPGVLHESQSSYSYGFS